MLVKVHKCYLPRSGSDGEPAQYRRHGTARQLDFHAVQGIPGSVQVSHMSFDDYCVRCMFSYVAAMPSRMKSIFTRNVRNLLTQQFRDGWEQVSERFLVAANAFVHCYVSTNASFTATVTAAFKVRRMMFLNAIFSCRSLFIGLPASVHQAVARACAIRRGCHAHGIRSVVRGSRIRCVYCSSSVVLCVVRQPF